MSGSEGIVAILNEEAEKRGVEARFTTMSRVVKEIYDKVQEAYNGQLRRGAAGRWVELPDDVLHARGGLGDRRESLGIEAGG